MQFRIASPGGTALMPHTYCTNLIHCVFSTKERTNSIADNIREQLFAYLFGIAKNLSIEILAIGGTANHIHILMAIPARESFSDIIRDLKANSSRWMSGKHYGFSWQQGFGAFSVSPSQVQTVKRYICNQADHHAKRNFEEEFLLLLKKSGVEYDPQYVFG
jgi:REP element-mobilizing transposase RayT